MTICPFQIQLTPVSRREAIWDHYYFLFILMIYKIASINCAIYRLFVDGISVSYAAKSMNERQSVINAELENSLKWLNTNKLRLNIAKTELMILEYRQRISG